eukprot:TRINITY_DN7491_c1_g1_i1.p1 TRINITY_DN7491_c1_g1~~TRINITY_DN7491_c1_g1_i1.p1  ORF type:complete len:346 (+),score=63.75 TRINITY_DN7491_c1_g1_i1:133-1170(+)
MSIIHKSLVLEKVEKEEVEHQGEGVSPTLHGIGRLFDESGCDSVTSDEDDVTRMADNLEALSIDDDIDYEEDYQIDDSHDSQSSDQFLNDEDPSEQSQDNISEPSEPSRPYSRYAGHRLSVEQLESQEIQIRQEKAAQREAYIENFRHATAWGRYDSMVKIKVLVGEGYRKEKQHLKEQADHLRDLEVLKNEPRPVRRFRQNFIYRDAGFHANPKDVLDRPELHKDVVRSRLNSLNARWRQIRELSDRDMNQCDYQTVIKNISMLRMFLEGQQSMSYNIDPFEQARRAQYHHSVIQAVSRQEGMFLDGILPNAAPLSPRKLRRVCPKSGTVCDRPCTPIRPRGHY